MKRIGSGIFFSALFLFSCADKEPLWDEAFTLESFAGGNKIGLEKLFQIHGKPVVIINFSAPHCKPCLDEMPTIKKLSIGSAPFLFIPAVSSLEFTADSDSEKTEEMDWVREEGLHFAARHGILPHSLWAPPECIRGLRITGFPETIIFYRLHGRWILHRKYVGILDENLLTRDLKILNPVHAGNTTD